MRQAITSDSQIEMNPLYRKMRERFTYNNGSMTIGEIMLYRAERDGYSEPVDQQVVPAPRSEKPIARSKKGTGAFKNFVKSHSVTFTCIVLTISALLVLSLMIPFLSGTSILGENVSAAESNSANQVVEKPVDTLPEAEESRDETSSFANVMDAFQFDFGN